MAQASAEKLEQTVPAEKERVASATYSKQLARTPEPPLPKEKGTEPSVHRWERFKVSESRTLAKEEIGPVAWRGRDGLHSEERQVLRR